MTRRTLEDFFDALRSNQRANSAIFAEWYALIVRIDDCFVRAGENLVKPEPLLAGGLLLRCQYAFKAAAAMALAGQVVELFPVLRTVLEYAGYCLTIYDTPALERVFIFRHASEAEMKLQKGAFKISAIRASIARRDGKAAELYSDLYQRTIDFGGHPNPHATFSAMDLGENEGEATLKPFAISKDPKIVTHALKCTGQVGLMALHILEHVFKPKFELLGISHEMADLANTGML